MSTSIHRPARVLIADDEQLAREGISDLVGTIEGFQVVATASDGRSAFRQAQLTGPDICVLDVKMPDMNGLEALEAIRTIAPEMRCIIYTGHDDFAFAQQAIRLKADDYLLKPATRHALERALRNARHEMQVSRLYAAGEPTTQWQLKNGISPMEEVFFRGLVAGDVSPADTAVQKDLMGIDLERVRALVLSIDDGHQIKLTQGHDRINQLRDSVRTTAQLVCLKRLGVRVPVLAVDGDVLLVLDESCFDPSFPRYLRHELQVSIEHDISVALGEPVALESLSDSYRGARERLAYRLALGGRRVIGPEDDARVDSNHKQMPPSALKKLKRSVRYVDRNAVTEWITTMLQHFRSHVSDPRSWRRFCFQIYEECHFVVRECIPDLETQLPAIDASRQLHDVSTAADLERWLRKGLDDLMVILETRCHNYSLALKKALDYIDRNYNREISLQELADYVQLNPSYLSNLISRGSGKTFVEHVTERRMERARELLASSEYNVAETAYELGYETPRYFSMVFKKSTGMTPSEFRQMAGENTKYPDTF